MTIEHEQWERMLSAIDADKNLSKDNVIGKIKEKLSQYSDEYKEWEGAGFGVNHLFAVEYGLLHLAIHNNLENVVNALLGVEGINANAKNGYGDTPLCKAARRGCTKTIRALIDNGADVNEKDNHECTPLHLACENGQTEVVNLLLKREDIDVNAISKDGYTPLHLATEKGYIEIVKTLIEGEGDVKAVDKYRNTPLHLAAKKGRIEIVKTLIEAGANVDAIDRDGRTSLHLAIQYGCKETVKTLIGAGANVNAADEDKRTPLHIATQFCRKEIVKILVEARANVNAADKYGCTPLHFAEDAETVKTLIGAGAKVNALDKDKRTPLHNAKNEETAKALIGAGAKVNAVDKDKCTPLHMAARRGCKEVIETLIGKRADLLSKNNDNKIPSDFDKNHYIVRHVNFLLSEERMKRHDQQGKISLVAFSLTILFGTAITITLFAIGTITAGLYPVIGAVVTVVAAALAVAYTTVRMLEPSTKMDETKEAQNVNGNVQEVFP
ncbi:ankyrin repeat domain-containing protein [Wolbachia endosymbiont (group A) of Sympetrum striolatum]|uniref:ankyrin repeat domain-containing protein n=1 Tax=Wolbachia endosymbiont (group A) of Sympetrum striolatum TaxID=2954061 RepID=UPI002226F851|nr:ankyrin repeat domain-containing protein [Wolbachia endosymbiont (group A) of Sympetrum striolatum]